MRRPVLLLLVVGLSSLLAVGEGPQKPVRILFAGSSSTYWNDLPREVARAVTGKLTSRADTPVVAEIVGRSGSDIRVYAEPDFHDYQYGVEKGQTFLEKVRAEKPDLVVLQVVCSFITTEEPRPGGAAHAQAVTRYCQAIRTAGGEPVFYEMGWGKTEREAEGRKRILDLAIRNRVKVYAPCSAAWARVYREKPGLALQHPKDGAHPGDAGHFLNVACFYAALTRTSPVGKLPRTFPVWPHALGKADTDEAKAADAARLAKFKPDDYQTRLPKWMHRNMAHGLTATLDEATATYLETVAWETWQETNRRLEAAGGEK